MTFLGLYSFVLLVDYFPLNTTGERRSGYRSLQIPITEIILHICLWSLILEEIRQVEKILSSISASIHLNVLDYFQRFDPSLCIRSLEYD